jgi:hypothetical protein
MWGSGCPQNPLFPWFLLALQMVANELMKAWLVAALSAGDIITFKDLNVMISPF